jgi:DNA-binding SARP family transcriptional activator
VADLVERAEAARESGDLDGAVESFREAHARTPWNDRIRRALAVSLADRAARSRETRRYAGVAAAETDLREALSLEPEDTTLRHNLGIVLLDLASRSMDPERAGALESEARTLLPEAEELPAPGDALRGRRLDMALELIERGQIEAGISRLAALHAEHPADVEIGLLLSRAHARHAEVLADRGDAEGAARSYGWALAVLQRFDPAVIPPAELEGAHRNRVTAWINAYQPDGARAALDDAERAGFRFPRLRRAIDSGH